MRHEDCRHAIATRSLHGEKGPIDQEDKVEVAVSFFSSACHRDGSLIET